jgi:hypothetical protein
MLESIYFQCYYAYLRGNLIQAHRYYTILKNEFKTAGSEKSLNPTQLAELKKIKEAIETGNIAKNKWLEEPVVSGTSTETAEIRQNELVKKIHYQGLEQLKKILSDDLWLYNIEHPCGEYGAVDMVYMGKKTVYPLEVKKDQGRHDLIGQLSKYDLFHKLHMHYKTYETVQSVAVCGAYEPYTLRELKQLGFKTIAYSLKDEKLRLAAL